MTEDTAQSRLDQLLERLLTAAETALAAGEFDSARATADEIRAVDPENERAGQLLERVRAQQRAPGGERALMTLLFSDLVDSTALSEEMEPEAIRDILTRYRAEAASAVERFGGYVMRYVGDGILAGFGYPNAHEDDARRAVLAGLDLVAAMRAARQAFSTELGVEPQVRVGIHTGRVVVTDVGATRRLQERDSIIGAAANLAARIQQFAAPDHVAVSDVTQQLVDADFEVHSLGMREFKGISRRVEVFAVDGPRDAATRIEADRYRRGVIVGRDLERARLEEAWEAITAAPHEPVSQGACFLVTGEAGIGKTRLVSEVSALVAPGSGQQLSARCLPYYSNISLWPIARMMARVVQTGSDDAGSDLAGLVDDLVANGLDPVATVPFIAPLLDIDDVDAYPTPQLEPSAFLDETYNQVAAWLGARAASSPLLLVVEDLQWADPSTVALLGRLTTAPPAGMMTIVTTRAPDLVPWLSAVEEIDLGRLDKKASQTLVEALAGDIPLDDELVETIIQRADGIPLFLEELTRTAQESGAQNLFPLRLQELLTGRLKAPGLDLRVSQVAATIGLGFDAETVGEVVGDPSYAEAQLAQLVDHGLIIADRAGSGAHRFRQALLRDAAYETQVLDVRRQTHASIADLLAARDAAPALIAEHLKLAGDPVRAVPLYLIGAQDAQGRGAHTEAARMLFDALELVDALPESDERDLTELTARMLRGLSVSSMQGYASPDVQADHRRAEVLATRLGSRPEVLPSLIAIWAYWLVSGDLGTSGRLIERLTSMVGDPAFAWFEPEVQSCAGYQSLYQGEIGSARLALEQAIAGFDSRPSDETVSPFWPLPNDPIAVSEIALACVAAIEGDPEESARWEDLALRRTGEIGFPRGPFTEAYVLTYAAWIRRFGGDHAAARDLGFRVMAIGHEYGYAYWVTLGSSYATTTEPDAAPDPAFLEQVIATLRLMGQQAFVPSYLARLAELYAEDGELDRALDLTREALENVHKSGETVHLPELLRQRASYLVALGEVEDGVADLGEALRVATEQGAAVSRLRAAIAVAELSEPHRPDGWRSALEAAAGDAPLAREVASARTLLG